MIVAVVGGLGTWLVAPAGTEHIGASGIVFGYATLPDRAGHLQPQHRCTCAVGRRGARHLRRDAAVRASCPRDGISWQGHLFGAIGGVIAAWALEARRTVVAVDRRQAALSA